MSSPIPAPPSPPASLPRVWAAPMAGGPTTPELVAAVGAAGGLGLLGAGYLPAEAFDAQITELVSCSDAPYGVNLFLPGARRGVPAELAAYAERLTPLADRFAALLGEPRWEDDAIDAKLDVVCARRPAVVSFTFGAPSRDVVARVRESTGALVVVTVTTPEDAHRAAESGADALCLQGTEAGGHRSLFDDDVSHPDGGDTHPVLELLRRVRAEHDALPLVASGGLMDGADVRAALDAGATAVQLGTAFLLCPEAGTNPAHRAALRSASLNATRVTRAFTGRPARGLDNMLARDPFGAPAAYPEVHHLTRPLRAAAAAAGDLDVPHFWAGTGWRAAREEPAGTVVRRITQEAGAAAAPWTREGR